MDKKLCRLCLSKKAVFHNIFNTPTKYENLSVRILLHLNLNIKCTDPVTLICSKCCGKIEQFHVYYQNVHENQKELAKLIGTEKTNNEEIKEEPIENVDDVCTIDSQTPSPATNVDLEVVKVEQTIDENFCVDEEDNTFPTIEPQVLLQVQNEMRSEPNEKNVTNEKNHIKDDTNPLEMDSDDEGSVSGLSLNSSENDDAEKNKKHEIENFEFPKTILKNGRFVIRNQKLLDLMERFFNLECDQCTEKKAFRGIHSLLSHYQNRHKVKGYVTCCQKKFYRRHLMAYHMAYHVQPEAFTCPKCGKKVIRPKSLEGHVRNHLPREQLPYQCTICSKKFALQSSLDKHQVVHLSSRPQKQCKDCGQTFNSGSQLTRHVRLVHLNDLEEFICDICGKTFNAKGNFESHRTIHESRDYSQCDICKKWFKGKTHLKRHMETTHSTIELKCDNCDYSTHSKPSLRAHMKRKHSQISDDKLFSCQYCEKKFKAKKHLISHISNHTGIPNYSCEFCPRQFASSGNFYKHRKRMHPNEVEALRLKKEEEARIIRENALKDQSTPTN